MAEVHSIVDEMDPAAAYHTLRDNPDSVLIDVRTRAEWSYVGLPDLRGIGHEVLLVEWAVFPAMSRNPEFLAELLRQMEGRRPGRMLFICRSGVRSMSAARAVAEALANQGISAHCTNVAEGFEGDLDTEGHRGRVNGWKVRGLPWRQN